jgi:hypothetical protein
MALLLILGLYTIIRNAESIHDTSRYLYLRTSGNSRFPTSAGNATLGFEKILYINLDHRYDLEDAMELQAWVSNITLARFPGVLDSTLQDKGLPPSSSLAKGGTRYKPGEACFRAHANAWRQIINENLSRTLILEADSVWDVHIQVKMKHLSAGLNELMKKYPNSPGTFIKGGESYAPESLIATENDPYCADSWDLLSFGQCGEEALHGDEYVLYHDPYGIKDENYGYNNNRLLEQRVIRRSGGITCTNAYAL